MRKRRITKITQAGPDHQVISITSKPREGEALYRRKPCEECPWRVDQVGKFPAEAFRISATTAYDAASNTFACHMSGSEKSAICAGFLLRNSVNNLMVRIISGRNALDMDKVSDGGLELHANYREMAIANGVDPDDPVLAPCRADDE